MPTEEEKRLFAELSRRGVHVPENMLKESDFDSSAGTTSVSPASPRDGLADYSPSGRGNPSERSGGTNMPPKVPGASAAPSPPQTTGSNLPGSGIRQLPPVTMDHQHASTTLQSPIPTPHPQASRYPGDFNKPNPLPMDKPDATDSDGVQNLSDKFASAGVPKKRVISQVVESKGA